MRARTLLLLALLPTLAACGGGEAEDAPLTLEQRVQADERLRPLLQPCSYGMAFTADTTDMTRVLADKLAFAQLEPLRRAKEELAVLGEEAMEDLERVFDGAFGNAFEQGIVTNVLDVCALMEGPWGVPLARRALDHTGASVRLNAFHVLARHGSPEDYDRVALFLPVTGSSMRDDVVETLCDLDPERLADDVVLWLREGYYPDLWKHTIPMVVGHARESVARELWRQRAELDPELEPFLNAMLARHGDAEALAALRSNLVDELNGKRKLALTAVNNAGLQREAQVVLERDVVGQLRFAAVEVLGELPPGEEVDGWLELALNDVDTEVRVAALGILAPRGNERAIAETLQLLAGSLGEREDAVRILRGTFPRVPGLARRALDVLVDLFEQRVSASSAERVSYLQAIGQVPLREAAEFLMAVGDRPEVSIAGMTGHRWAAIQVYNTGPTGIAVLHERLARETDLFRRIDLLHTIWQAEDDRARETLLAIAGDPETSPYELLYVAERLARIGPAATIAPALKRIYLANTDPIARPGLQCLLWSWYG